MEHQINKEELKCGDCEHFHTMIPSEIDMLGQQIKTNLLTRGVYIINANDVFVKKLIVR
jgi:hypothetical protein